jgi:septal ring factor EnvC (AmiA/AmiB activator)
MASHRRAKTPVRTAITLSATGAAAATGVGLSATTGHAASVADVQAQIKTLQAQAEQATNQYDAAAEQMAVLQKQVDQIQSQATSAQQEMNTLLGRLGPLAAAQYRTGSLDPTLALMLSQNPDQYLQKALTMNQQGQNEVIALKALKAQQAQLAALKKQASDRLGQMQQAESQAATLKTQILAKNRQAQALLLSLTTAQQQQVNASEVNWNVTAAQIAPCHRSPAAPARRSPSPNPRSASTTSGAVPATPATTAPG